MTDTRTIILVHTTHANRNGADPAIDFDAPGVSAALTEYQRTRSDEARAKIQLRKGMRLAEFTIARLSQAALRYVLAGRTATEQAHFAVIAGCHRYTDADGHDHAARVSVGDSGIGYADDAWLEEIGGEYGGAALIEIGHAIIQWTQAPRRALDPFGSVPGLVLVR